MVCLVNVPIWQGRYLSVKFGKHYQKASHKLWCWTGAVRSAERTEQTRFSSPLNSSSNTKRGLVCCLVIPRNISFCCKTAKWGCLTLVVLMCQHKWTDKMQMYWLDKQFNIWSIFPGRTAIKQPRHSDSMHEWCTALYDEVFPRLKVEMNKNQLLHVKHGEVWLVTLAHMKKNEPEIREGQSMQHDEDATQQCYAHILRSTNHIFWGTQSTTIDCCQMGIEMLLRWSRQMQIYRKLK